MANTFFGLSIGKAGLYTYQAALNTAAHNASNADTKGYTRQQVIQSASTAISVNNSYGMQGTGVDVDGVEQVRDSYYDTKYWKNSSIYGSYTTKAYYLDDIQSYFSEVSSDGSTAALDDFFGMMSTLSNNVKDGTNRTQVSESAVSLTQTINTLYNRIQSLQKECNTEIKNTADQVNSIAQRISSLTFQINTIEIKGVTANDLRDSRNLLVDELSQLANTTVTETPVGDDIGVNQYIVRLNGKTLVDTYEYNALKATPQESSVNQNDVEGLYTLSWEDGQNFDSTSNTLGGKLQALFEMRDGNNKVNFNGTGNGTNGSTTLTVTKANINDEINLNIPDSDGKIVVGNREYEYSSFDATVDANGSYTYTFKLKEGLAEAVTNTSVKIGNSVDCKGIPYFQAQLNKFTRTMASSFNDIHRTGEDLYGNKGIDFFTATLAGSGDEYSFGATLTSLTSLPDASTSTNGYVKASYYHVTAGNFKVNSAITDDPKKIACAEYDANADTGVEDKTVLNKLIALKGDMSMFKQGTPDMFLQTVVAEVGIDAKTAMSFATSQENIIKVVEIQRASISGVDSDEEAIDLVKFKNAYDLCSKVISVMNEIYDKLINSTGV